MLRKSKLIDKCRFQMTDLTNTKEIAIFIKWHTATGMLSSEKGQNTIMIYHHDSILPRV